jgi:hypothetical protein
VTPRTGFADRSVDRLRLDPRNPRLPEDLRGRPQDELLLYLYENGVLEELANSFLDNGYFEHEPLIVTPDEDHPGHWIVVEGNRRLATLMILFRLEPALDADVEFLLDPSPTEWQLERLRQVPSYEVASPEAVHEFLGFRHIGGIKTWSAEAKARYLLGEVERLEREGTTGNVFSAVARRVGSNAQGVRNPYIALRLLLHARDEFGTDIADVQRRRFGVWTRCMNSKELRSYIGFNGARTYADVQRQLPQVDEERLAEVIGDLTPREGRRAAVLADSRDVTAYAGVLVNPTAHQVLRKFNDLTLAKQVADKAALPTRLSQLYDRVDVVMREVQAEGAPPDALEPARRLERITKSLAAVIASFATDA